MIGRVSRELADVVRTGTFYVYVIRPGDKFGRIVVLKKQDGKWLCRCSCGKEILISTGWVRFRKGCGCHRVAVGRAAALARRLPQGEGAIRSIFATYSNSAKKRGHEFTLTKQDLTSLVSKTCYYCGREPSQESWVNDFHHVKYNGLDRVDNEKGYTIDNVVTSCYRCNRAKAKMTKDQFLDWVSRVYKFLVLGEKTVDLRVLQKEDVHPLVSDLRLEKHNGVQVPLPGSVSGWLTASSVTDKKVKMGSSTTRYPVIECLCRCGRKRYISSYSFVRMDTKSCGCYNANKSRRKDGKSSVHVAYSQYSFGARKRKLPFELSERQFSEIVEKPCAYCGEYPVYRKFKPYHGIVAIHGIDRIDNSLGYTLSNSAPCCRTCNIGKWTRTRDDFISLITEIYLHLGLQPLRSQERSHS